MPLLPSPKNGSDAALLHRLYRLYRLYRNSGAIVVQQWCNGGDCATGKDLTSGTYRGIIFVRKPLVVKSEDSVDHKSSQGIARSATRRLLDLALVLSLSKGSSRSELASAETRKSHSKTISGGKSML
jgi:hypothetical protein